VQEGVSGIQQAEKGSIEGLLHYPGCWSKPQENAVLSELEKAILYTAAVRRMTDGKTLISLSSSPGGSARGKITVLLEDAYEHDVVP
jgi:hypothetical protein